MVNTQAIQPPYRPRAEGRQGKLPSLAAASGVAAV
jgi:hypothetical protein